VAAMMVMLKEPGHRRFSTSCPHDLTRIIQAQRRKPYSIAA
jgi:hypothetical protein